MHVESPNFTFSSRTLSFLVSFLMSLVYRIEKTFKIKSGINIKFFLNLQLGFIITLLRNPQLIARQQHA